MIDFHTHIFPEKIAKPTLDYLESRCKTKPYTNGIAEGLSKSTDDAGIDLSIVLPVVTKPSQFQSINRFARELKQDNLLSFGGIHPDCDDYKAEINTIKEWGFQGIKLHPDYQGVFIDDIRYERIISYASEKDLIVSVHAGFDPGYPECTHCTPQKAAKMIEDVRPSKLVLAHMGGFQRWDEVEKNLVGKEVYLDTAVVFGFISEEQFTRICRNHGTDKILFATDSPWSGQRESVEMLRAMDLTDCEKEQIFDGNARNLLTL